MDDDVEALALIERELDDRYGRHYQVVCLRTPAEANERLAEWAESGVDVALVLAADELPGTPGGELLGSVRRWHPHARRALLVEWGQWGQNPTGQAIFDGVAHGRFEHWVLRPDGVTGRAVPPDDLGDAALTGTEVPPREPPTRSTSSGSRSDAPSKRAPRGAAAVRPPAQLLPGRDTRGQCDPLVDPRVRLG